MKNVTKKNLNTDLENFKRTKMIATVGPATNDYETILEMLKKGVNGFRLNFSHGTHAEKAQQIKWIRKSSKDYSKPVAIIQDLQGPKIRLGDCDGMKVRKGQTLTLQFGNKISGPNTLPIQYDISKKVKKGERILIFDGRIRAKVLSVSPKKVKIHIENSGEISSRKGINLPDTDFAGDVITKKDLDDIAFGAKEDIDYVAMSFVQTAKDIKKLRNILDDHKSDAKIIAKIETKVATENINEIILVSDAVMVARGDLALETEAEAIPILQRAITGKCIEYGKPSIIATQMLASMVDEPEPTRAEVSDVATAVIVGADAVMLSEETAAGEYPLQSIDMMKRIIIYTQNNAPLKPLFFKEEDNSTQSAISSAVITLAHQVGARAIVAETKSGATARSIAAHRPSMPIIMVTSEKRVSQQLAIVYGGKTFLRPDGKKVSERLEDWLRKGEVFKKGDVIVGASGRRPGKVGGTDTIKVRVIE